eukprot:11329266-Prorocentrum_lima.AAC.1
MLVNQVRERMRQKRRQVAKRQNSVKPGMKARQQSEISYSWEKGIGTRPCSSGSYRALKDTVYQRRERPHH